MGAVRGTPPNQWHEPDLRERIQLQVLLEEADSASCGEPLEESNVAGGALILADKAVVVGTGAPKGSTGSKTVRASAALKPPRPRLRAKTLVSAETEVTDPSPPLRATNSHALGGSETEVTAAFPPLRVNPKAVAGFGSQLDKASLIFGANDLKFRS